MISWGPLEDRYEGLISTDVTGRRRCAATRSAPSKVRSGGKATPDRGRKKNVQRPQKNSGTQKESGEGGV